MQDTTSFIEQNTTDCVGHGFPGTLQEQIARASEFYHSAMITYFGKEVVDGF